MQKLFFCRNFGTSLTRSMADIAKRLKGKSKSSQAWIRRQLKDPYREKLIYHNFRCRSAFKLLEINEKHNILMPGYVVVDCGAAPGSWSQVAVNCVNSDGTDPEKPIGRVIGIDLLPIHPVNGATFVADDFRFPSAQQKLVQLLDASKVDLVMSDMAPNATGIKSADHDSIIRLAMDVLTFAVKISKVNSSCLIKIWNGRDTSRLEEKLGRFYSKVRLLKPNASRSDSAEVYLLACNFKGLKTDSTT